MIACEVAGPWVLGADGVRRMKVIEDHPGPLWKDATGQMAYDVLEYGLVVAYGEVTAPQLAAINADPEYAVLWSIEYDPATQQPPAPPVLTTEQKNALRSKLAAIYAPDVAKWATLYTDDPVIVSEALKEASLRPPWQVGTLYAIGEVVLYQGNLYECVQGHTTQAGWEPNTAVALWKRFYEPTDDPWPWAQPLGAHDAYRLGARVTHNGSTWESTLNANVWQPGVTGWTNLTPPAAQEWTFPKAYAVNDEVTYQGSTYRCQQAHTSQAGWTPPVVPALWLLL